MSLTKQIVLGMCYRHLVDDGAGFCCGASIGIFKLWGLPIRPTGDTSCNCVCLSEVQLSHGNMGISYHQQGFWWIAPLNFYNYTHVP